MLDIANISALIASGSLGLDCWTFVVSWWPVWGPLLIVALLSLCWGKFPLELKLFGDRLRCSLLNLPLWFRRGVNLCW